MFAGGRRRSSNVRAMQLFHELKQQFPTVPDHVVTACIAANSTTPLSTSPDCGSAKRSIVEELEAAANQQKEERNEEKPPMGLITEDLSADTASEDSSDSVKSATQETNQMTENDPNQNTLPNVVYTKKDDAVNVNPDHPCGKSTFFVKRPTQLDINQTSVLPTRKETYLANNPKLQPSEKCKDVHKLLNSKLAEKPPRSPSGGRKLLPNKPTPKPETETPASGNTSPITAKTTQTTDTLLPGVNLSLNVNCSMDVVQSPTRPARRRSSVLEVTPEQPWLQDLPSTSPSSPARSYTSVSLTLRPPSSEPQAPIDITSSNSSLTYSTSTFDSQKGLQSRLQITVGPAGGSVSSVRTRPRSSYLPIGDGGSVGEVVRAESLPDLAEPPVVLKQQARIERLRIEINTEKAKLVVMKQEVSELENNQKNVALKKLEEEQEKQLVAEIRHLRGQCERLESEVSQISEGFYQNIYTGQRLQDLSCTLQQHHQQQLQQQRPIRGRLQYQGPLNLPQPEPEGPKWNCHLCTFQNHPALNKCEQCDMPRILHGTPDASSSSGSAPSFSHPNRSWPGRGRGGYAMRPAPPPPPTPVTPPQHPQQFAVFPANLMMSHGERRGFWGGRDGYSYAPVQGQQGAPVFMPGGTERVSQI